MLFKLPNLQEICFTQQYQSSKSAGICRNPQESAGVRRNPQKSAPTSSKTQMSWSTIQYTQQQLAGELAHRQLSTILSNCKLERTQSGHVFSDRRTAQINQRGLHSTLKGAKSNYEPGSNGFNQAERARRQFFIKSIMKLKIAPASSQLGVI